MGMKLLTNQSIDRFIPKPTKAYGDDLVCERNIACDMCWEVSLS